MLIAFSDTDFVVEVPDEREFLDALRGAAIGWPFAPVEDGRLPVATIEAVGRAYRILSDDGEPVEVSAVGAACSAIVDVVKGYVNQHPKRLCFHCASIEFNGRLVIFPSRYRAGKSTLAARLAVNRHVVFGDDVLPLAEGDRDGIALGLAPRLRLPLPGNASEAFRRFVVRHAGPSDEFYQYLNLPNGGLAKGGSTLPLGAVVLLDRRPEGSVRIGRAGRSAALRALITRNFARGEPAGIVLDRLHAVMERLPLFVLQYSDLEDAVIALERVFSTWPPRIDELAVVDEMPVAAESEDVSVYPVADGSRLRQNPAIRLRAIDGELFLTDDEGLAIYHLNAVGAGLWNLLTAPTSETEAIEVLRGAFPDADPDVVARDVRTLFAALLAGKFALAGDTTP